MKFSFISLAVAVVVLVVSAAPIGTYTEAMTELPARFAMYLVTDEPRANGLRVGYVNGNLHMNIIESPHMSSGDAVFLSNRGRIALDGTVHTGPTTHRPANPELLSDGNVISQPDAAVMQSMQKQAVLGSVEGRFVQNSMGMLRVVGPDGELQNGLGIDGVGRSAYTFWWEGVRYTQPNAELRIVPLGENRAA